MNGISETARSIGRDLLVMAAIGLLAALIGPFGTYAAPLGIRIGQWELFTLGGYLFFRPVIAGGEALSARSALPRLAGIALACLLASFPTTMLVAWGLSGMALSRLSVGDLAALFPDVLVMGGIATAVQLAVARARRPAHRPVEAPASRDLPAPVTETQAPEETLKRAAAPAPFLARLPAHLGAELLAIENEDHYVRVHTALGSTLLLMRMRDAVAELADIDGLRVHRGWWVARAAVAQVLRRDRAMALRLVNGLEVPVARNEVPAIRAAGWV